MLAINWMVSERKLAGTLSLETFVLISKVGMVINRLAIHYVSRKELLF